MTHPDTDRLAGYKLLKTAALVDFEVVKTELIPSTADDIFARVEVQLANDEEQCDGEWGGLGFMFALAVLSLADARAQGYGVNELIEGDEYTVADLVDHLRFERGELRFSADYVRGRRMKTDMRLTSDGLLVLDTRGRGETPLRWIDTLKGKKTLTLIPGGKGDEDQ